MRAALLAVTLSTLSLLPLRAQEDTVALGGRQVVVWHPANRTGRHPVVVFSHGLGGCPTQSRFLTAGLAAHGYLVVAPFHRDAGCGRKNIRARHPDAPFASPGK